MFRRLAALALACLAGGCSPYAYTSEIDTFAQGVGAFTASYAAGKQAMAADATAEREARWVGARTRLAYLPGCLILEPIGTPPARPDCAVVRAGRTAPPPPTPAERLVSAPDAALIFSALSRYAAALQAVTSAADAAALDKAVTGLDAAVGGLSVAAGNAAPNSKANATIAAAGAGVLTEGVAILLDQRRLAALRRDVVPMQGAITVLATAAAKVLDTITNDRETRLLRRIGADDRPLLTDPGRLTAAAYRADETRLLGDVAALDALRAGAPIAAGQALVTAHARLVAALQNPGLQLRPVLAALSAFSTRAVQLRAAIAAGAGKPPAAS